MNSTDRKLPYYAVIFTSVKKDNIEGYSKMAIRMLELAEKSEGFLGVDDASDKIDITISYWENLESIKKWRNNIEHKEAQKLGKESWYNSYKIKIAKVENEYEFSSEK